MKLQNNLFTLITEDNGLIEVCVNYAINKGNIPQEPRVKRVYTSRKDISHPRWSQEEINLLLNKKNATPSELRTELPRHTKQAIASMKYKIKFEKYQNPRIKSFVRNYYIGL